jgi:sec-independent protein translocase protein TatA
MCAGNGWRAEDGKMGELLQPTHLIVIGIIVFLLFGAKRLPELGKGLGEGFKGFKEGIKGMTDPSPTPNTSQHNVTPPPAPPAAPGNDTKQG